MRPPVDSSDQQRSPDVDRNRRQAVALVVEEVLSDLPPDLANSIRLSSIPHWLTIDLLTALFNGEHAVANEVMAEVEALNLTQQDGAEQQRYPQAIRDYMRAWCRENLPTAFQAVNHHALVYFRGTIHADELLGPKQVEILYHLLAEDEAQGLAYLREHFEVAQDQQLLDQAERLVLRAAELGDELSATGQAWVRYYTARLDQRYRRGDNGAAIFSNLTIDSPDQVLGAFARWSLGNALVEQQRWSEAIRLYKQSVAVLRQKELLRDEASIQIAIGDAYRDLALRSGDLSPTVRHRIGATGNPLHDLQHLPFLLYKWLVRYVPLLPNWYFGTEYQDWIVAYLLEEATRWYKRGERAIRRAAGSSDAPSLVRVQLLLADLEHRLGRWWSAHRRFALLRQLKAVRHSRYRSALVQLGEGQALLVERHPAAAEKLLTEAVAELQRFQDAPALGKAAQALGEARLALGAVEVALDAFAIAIDAFYTSGDRQARTQLRWQLSQIKNRPNLSAKARQQAEQLRATIGEQLYITRFPDGLLRRFRRLTLYCVLPLNYLLTFVFIFALFQDTFKVVEGELRLSLLNLRHQISAADGAALLRFALSPLLLFWIYHLVYSLAGRVSARLLGRQLVPIEREQPDYILVNAKTITYHQVNQQRLIALPWQDIKAYISRDYLLRQHPYALFSRALLIGQAEPDAQQIPLSGVTFGYGQLKQAVQAELVQQTPQARWHDQNFFILDIRWIVLVVVVAGLLAAYRLEAEWWGILGSSVVVNLWVTPFAIAMLNWLLHLYPLTLLWRLLWRRHLSQAERPMPIVPTWVLRLGFFLQFVWVLIWVLDLFGYPLLK